MASMLPLVFGSLALLLGPLLALAGERRPWLRLFVTGFVVVAIGGIVVLHAVPEAFERLSWGALPLLGLGVLLPSLGEKFARSTGAKSAVAWVAVALFLVHALLDGAVLGKGEAGLLALAVVLHRIPEGIAIWWFVSRSSSRSGAALALAAAAVAPFVGSALFANASLTVSAAVQATVAGALLHVLLHHAHFGHGRACQGEPSHSRIRCSAPAAAGALVASLVLVASTAAHAEAPPDSSADAPTGK